MTNDQELNASEVEQLCRKRLLVNTRNNELAKAVLSQNNINAGFTSENILEILDENSIENPDNIAGVLVNNKVPPTMLSVIEEDLESFFLRTIGVKH